MTVRIVSGIMAAVFVLAVAVQYNDPDPLRWAAIYGAAGVLSAWVAVRGSVPRAAPVVVGVVALVWASFIARHVPDWQTYAGMFSAWEMTSPAIEQAREVCGLVIIAVWMAALAIGASGRRPQIASDKY